ncbi:hypothetical protein BV394_03930 [Brevirhabdus pacifica]|uniref:Uncharacterized protein n=1 Tax=Brevirhabdus pacifica TaxID=1267768 RepID=A0A1U7DG92_9RHOB|nr:hypothetical protein [Brevirhabdus pacifica]APX88981.1 hypothetical protein BV394_03930 [Brevirhabdus pacifica]OWU80202.1 hypothetical protein ATO5_04615 [Loktanella sp. 22II-4b]PJJ86458.1 hypothetical protein CLV77_1005 [Brevirhabdus pacifica]
MFLLSAPFRLIALPFRRFKSPLARLLELDAAFRETTRLERLDDSRLRDMGLERHAGRTARRAGRTGPTWDSPAHWRR